MNYEDELAWENEMIEAGIQRFRASQDKALEAGREIDTSAGTRLLKSFIAQVSEYIAHYVAGAIPGVRRSAWVKLIQGVAPDKLALFALHSVIEATYRDKPMNSVAASIGSMVEDELRFMKFEIEEQKYYETIVGRLDDSNSSSYRHRKRVLVNGMNKQDVEWDKWGNEQVLNVGLLLIACVRNSTDLVEIKKRRKGRFEEQVITPTEELTVWINDHNSAVEGLLPVKLPMLVPPEDWTNHRDGGYMNHKLKHKTPLIKMRRDGRDLQTALVKRTDIQGVCQAVNAMQKTAWCINEPVLAVMKQVWESDLGIGMPRTAPYEFPKCPIAEGVDLKSLSADDQERFDHWKLETRELHVLENNRQAAVLDVSRNIRTANTLAKHKEFYYVYQCDFRGRVYPASSGITPQGADLSKSLLHFRDAKPLGNRGAFWLKVHGANKYGFDKATYDERVKWIDDQRATWLSVADDPLANRDAWSGADKPYQFLAFCFEYAGMLRTASEGDYCSRLAVALDGSCNGIQHFSAMLRDSVGGAAVNLRPSSTCADIYQDVADVATRKLREIRSSNGETSGAAGNWLALFDAVSDGRMPRGLSKKPVMTLPYGSTQQACTSSVYQWYAEKGEGFFPKETSFRHAIFMSRVLWDSIKEVVIAARAAMEWIQKATRCITKAGSCLTYQTHLNFPVVQSNMEVESKFIQAQIGGRLRLRINKETDELSKSRQANGSAPNLVHSVDACHMQMCLIEGAAQGIDAFAMIHDDFGVHACDTEKWHGIIRHQFVKLHTEFNPLQHFKDVHEALGIELPALPPQGDLDLNEVLDSDFFFG